jgi:Na+/melibiose symporter-like transporter
MDVSRFHVEVATALGTAALGLLAVLGAVELGFGWEQGGPEPGYFPFYVGLILVFASLLNLVAAVLRHRRSTVEPANSEQAEEDEAFLDRERLTRIAQFLLPMVLFVIGTIWLGIYVSSLLYIAWSVWHHGGHRPWKALGAGLAFSVVLYLVFETAFRVPLLKGPIEPLLGIH